MSLRMLVTAGVIVRMGVSMRRVVRLGVILAKDLMSE